MLGEIAEEGERVKLEESYKMVIVLLEMLRRS